MCVRDSISRDVNKNSHKEPPYIIDLGTPDEVRTRDPSIKSAVLYQLSYGSILTGYHGAPRKVDTLEFHKQFCPQKMEVNI